MRRFLSPTISFLFWLALTVWLGGLVTLGAAIVPAVVNGSGISQGQVAAILAASLGRFGRIAEAAGLLMVGVQFLERRRYLKVKVKYVWDGVRQVLTIGALLLAETCRYSLLPIVQSLAPANRRTPLAEYAALSIAEAVMLVIVLAITVWLQAP